MSSIESASGSTPFSPEITSKGKGKLLLTLKDSGGHTLEVQAKHLSKKISNPHVRRLSKALTSICWKKLYLPTGQKLLVSRLGLFKQRRAVSEETKLFLQHHKFIRSMSQAGQSFTKTRELIACIDAFLPKWKSISKQLADTNEYKTQQLRVTQDPMDKEKVFVNFGNAYDYPQAVYNVKTGEITFPLRELGRGAFKEIMLEVYYSSGKAVAKAQNVSEELTEKDIAQQEHEKLMRYAGSPHIINSYRIGGEYCLEYMNKGALSDIAGLQLLKQLSDDPRARLQLMIDICNGVKVIHDKGRVHNDLAPANILLKEVWRSDKPSLVVKIADFDLEEQAGVVTNLTHPGRSPSPEKIYATPESKHKNTQAVEEQVEANLTHSGRSPSPEKIYATPELKYKNTQADDIWSLGLVLHYIASGGQALPFENRHRDTYGAALEQYYTESQGVQPGTEAFIIRQALAREPSNRPSIDELIAMLEKCKDTLPSTS